MKNPKVKLKMDVDADINNCINFIKYSKKDSLQFVDWFLTKDLKKILNGKISGKNKNKIISNYVKNFYNKNKEDIKKERDEVIKRWEKIEKQYFMLVNKIFKNHPWPKGKYIGYISIFNIYPRNVKEKTFYFPYKSTNPKLSNLVIAHELLHFIFFDYLKKNYNLQTDSKISGKKSNYLWQISEVFNFVIENWKLYYEILQIKSPPYTGKDYFKKMKSQWNKKQDIDWLLNQWLK